MIRRNIHHFLHSKDADSLALVGSRCQQLLFLLFYRLLHLFWPASGLSNVCESLETGEAAKQHVNLVRSSMLYPTPRLEEDQETVAFLLAFIASPCDQSQVHSQLSLLFKKSFNHYEMKILIEKLEDS